MTIIFFFCAALSLFVSCSPRQAGNGGGGGAIQLGQIQFADDEGREVSLNESRRRIISLYGAHTENLFAIGAGDAVIGVEASAAYPAEAALRPRYHYTGDPERIIAASPDLVLIRPFVRRQYPAYIGELEKAGILVASLYPETLDDFDYYIMRLALLTDKEKEAREALMRFHNGLNAVQETAKTEKKIKVFFETTAAEIRTAAAGSLPAMAIQFTGAENIAAGAKPVTKNSSIASFGMERLLINADSIDVYIVQQGTMNTTANIDALKKRPGFNAIKAVRNGNVLFIDEKIISSPTFRYLEGVRNVQQFIATELNEGK